LTEKSLLTKEDLLAQMAEGWSDFRAYLQGLSEAQMSRPTDAAGWTAKDHVMHLAVWEAGIVAVMQGGSRREGMGIDEALWQKWDVDGINAVIQQRYRELSADEVMVQLRDVHQRLTEAVKDTTEADLQRSFRSYQPDTNYEGTLADRILANTAAHFAEHQPWIVAIVGK
jgi:hypothetical protein